MSPGIEPTFAFGLRVKLILIVVTGLVAGVLTMGIFRAYQANQSIVEDIERSGQERIALLAESLSNLVVGYDYSNMESLADRVVRQQDVRQMTIRNQDGKVMVTRDSEDFRPNAKMQVFRSPVLFSGKPVGDTEIKISLERLDAALVETYRNIAVILVLFAVFMSAIIYAAISRAILLPIARFRDLMTNILNDPSGGAQLQLEITTRDEIGELAAIFNSMNDKVHEYQQRLEEKYLAADSALVVTNEQLKTRTAELEKTLALVEQLATTDSLTSLPNRRYFDDFLVSAYSRAVRFKEPLCMILLDVDHFKQINDQHGHAVGDAVLQELGRLIRERTRETDACARFGGDEFALLLYHTDGTEAFALAEALLHKVRAHAFMAGGTRLPVTLSIGIAQLTAVTLSVEELYGAADQALYEAKRLGRNLAVCYPF
ncbi:MAG: sensor domain-containing diguanylate cyclase [Rhodocyclaceae bacterium]|nr:MAG: sensor domain-containing diguanylate cyclase [Rhodocyclaceae bacterium]